jgi:capsular polysaccharide biosynthesis protein
MDMWWRMLIRIEKDPQTIEAMHGDHDETIQRNLAPVAPAPESARPTRRWTSRRGSC